MLEIVSVLEQNVMLFYVMAFIVGLIVGSFINVVILRMPPLLEFAWKKDFADFTESEFKDEKPPGIAFTRSHCPKCKNQLSSWHNIPLFSYLILRGRCHFCKEKISVRYPFVEFLTAVLTLLMAYQFGFGLAFLAACLLLWMLIVITWIDVDTYLIPDQLSLSLLWLGLFFSLFGFSIQPEEAIKGALIGYLCLWLVFHLFKLITGKEGMGYGDFKLLAAGGAWLGPELLIAVLFIASISGLVFALLQMIMKKGSNKIPFGPYLSMGILVSYLLGDQIINFMFPGL
ncbi:Leader peptidase (Prepilin peptidase) / N-methyltransferase [hydrothermal vent metagenome]|uniref:Leader peptidase (Prepilin peptidase) / N-methyltransferase n=1 Tax=hydrothermal vent metagenome TaxID=652676 RepID=A0A3B0WRB1_9ZZZZ